MIASPADCLLLAPLTTDGPLLQFASTAIEPALPSPLCRESNGSGNAGGTCLKGSHIPVLFNDLYGAVIPISSFHSPLPNPNAGASITDIRWQE
jgi:hypothetical protein